MEKMNIAPLLYYLRSYVRTFYLLHIDSSANCSASDYVKNK